MDVYAQGLLCAEKLMEEGTLPGMLQKRYETFNSGLGAKVATGQTSFEELEQYALKHEPTPKSGQQELYEAIFNRHCGW